MSRILICLFFLVFFLMGCASKTIIRSTPEGAEVYIDNLRMGTTFLPYFDTAIAGSTKSLKLKIEGYRTFETTIRKSEFQVGPCVGGVLVLFPFICILGYPEVYEFELEELPEA
ncbi:MAG: PEGA domain-containing protein [Deltaproteobacteria bacterium]|nr:PEGA domain-containing protein [Deltaproteobacteria bacterium]